jgi:hypothetical protein
MPAAAGAATARGQNDSFGRRPSCASHRRHRITHFVSSAVLARFCEPAQQSPLQVGLDTDTHLVATITSRFAKMVIYWDVKLALVLQYGFKR